MATPARAESAARLVAKGNSAYDAGRYDEALDRYDEASVDAPESAHIYFNRGAVHYQKEDFEAAKEAFKEAGLKARQPELGARAQYNLGNCAFREAERQQDTDLAKAIEFCQSAVAHYQDALKLDPALKQAAENIEIVRLYAKVLIDEQKRRQEEQAQQQQQQDDLGKKLKDLIERQQAAAASNRTLAGGKPDPPAKAREPAPQEPGHEAQDPDFDPLTVLPDADEENPTPAVDPGLAAQEEYAAKLEEWADEVHAQRGDQQAIQNDTSAVLEEMQQMGGQILAATQTPSGAQNPGQPQAPRPDPAAMQAMIQKLEAAMSHVGDAINEQGSAIGSLAKQELDEARTHQTAAVEKLVGALKELADPQQQQQPQEGDQEGDQEGREENKEGEDEKESEDQDGDQQGNQDEGEEEEPGEEMQLVPVDDTARDILDEEKENLERFKVRGRGFRRVDKDW